LFYSGWFGLFLALFSCVTEQAFDINAIRHKK